MGRPRLCTEEEALNRRREIQRIANKKYYDANAEMLREKKRIKQNTGKHKNIVIIDTQTGDEFEYNSVRECSEDMYINNYNINKCLSRGTIHNGYKFQRRV